MREASLTKMDYLLPCSEPVGGESQRNLKKKKKSLYHFFLWFFNQLMENIIWKVQLLSKIHKYDLNVKLFFSMTYIF